MEDFTADLPPIGELRPLRYCVYCNAPTFWPLACPICHDHLVRELRVDVRNGDRKEFTEIYPDDHTMLCRSAASALARESGAFVAWQKHIHLIMQHAQEQGF